MKTLHSIAELRSTLAAERKAGKRIALVPTMGNLHAGHLALVERAKSKADVVVASVFVNPLQFGPNEDLDRYPRTLEQDRQKLQAAGCHLLFAPSVAEMYPRGMQGLTRVEASAVSARLWPPRAFCRGRHGSQQAAEYGAAGHRHFWPQGLPATARD